MKSGLRLRFSQAIPKEHVKMSSFSPNPLTVLYDRFSSVSVTAGQDSVEFYLYDINYLLATAKP
jgi:hypothetical protein